MFKARRIFGLLAVALLATLLVATVAQATPVEWKSIDLTIHSDQQQTTFMVYGALPDGAKLPQEAELAVPEGAQLQWIGEVLGGDLSQDPEVKYERSTSSGLDIYRFKMAQGRKAQVETVLPVSTTFDGKNYKSSVTWKAWRDIPEVRISQRVPASAQIVEADSGATLQTDDATYSYYTKTLTNVKKGDDVTLNFTYALPAAGAATGSAGAGGNDRLIVGLIGVVFIAGVMFLIMNVQRKAAEKRGVDEDAAKPAAKTVAEKRQPVQEVVVAAPRKKSPILPMVVVIVLIIGAFVFAAGRATSSDVVNGKITRDFGSASACQEGSVPFTVKAGVDLKSQGAQLLKGFEGLEGVGVVTVDVEQSKINLEWCQSSQSPESMKQVLLSSNLIELGELQYGAKAQ